MSLFQQPIVQSSSMLIDAKFTPADGFGMKFVEIDIIFGKQILP